jgi:DNA polymerase-3 subunit alpha
MLTMEKEMLGLYISDHPLHQWQPVLAQRVTVQLAHLPDLPDRKEVIVGGLVSSVKRTITRSGSSMAFLTLEDLTGSVEVVVFPRVYEQQGFALKRDTVLLMRGKVDIQEQTAKLLCEEVLPLPPTPEPATSNGDARSDAFAAAAQDGHGNGDGGLAPEDPTRPPLRIRVTTREEIDQLERYLLDHPGDRQVCVHVVTERGEEHIVPARVRLRDAEGLHQELEQMFGEGNVWEE